jgi:L-ascorbate metabolism protein UlaG (beta-lactamase superfamily)
MILLLYVLSTLIVLFFIVGYFISAPVYKGPTTDHFNGATFTNPTGIKAKGLRDVLKWMFARKQGLWKEIKQATFGEKPAKIIGEGIRITFVNHTTFLIQTENLNILTDPVWSERTSPFSFAGPKRMRPPSIRLEDLPIIDLILLSHNHYDHLDVSTLQRIVKEHKPRIVTPLGVKNFLEQEKMKGAEDMDWWQEIKVSDSLIIQAVPAQHFSGRGMFDRDKTLWCGYVIKRKEGNLYFAGDTGYNEKTFKEIGERCAPITVSILPIGAYKPNWFMSPIHTSPADAVKIFLDTKTKAAVASHFGTFPLADDGGEDPINDLAVALKGENLSTEKFVILPEGTHKDF